MSGGSFNHLCYKDAVELVNSVELIESMRDALRETGRADDAAQKTDELLAVMACHMNHIQALAEKLRIVWHGMEWWRSMDYSEGSFIEALEKWRAANA